MQFNQIAFQRLSLMFCIVSCSGGITWRISTTFPRQPTSHRLSPSLITYALCDLGQVTYFTVFLTFSSSGISMIQNSNNPVGGDEDEIKNAGCLAKCLDYSKSSVS